MGDQAVIADADEATRHRFSRALLEDLEALERIIAEGHIETGVRRLGFEQEAFLVGPAGRPRPLVERVLGRLADPDFTVEIGRFNCEHNVPPARIGPGVLHQLESHLNSALARLRSAAQAEGADVALVGILPSIELGDLVVENLTARERYHELNRVITRMAGGTLRTLIQGRDNLQLALDSVMLEACNTSIQVHVQVAPEEFARIYNIIQLVSGPVVATAANSPLLLQHRCWHESRIPAFEQAIDVRSSTDRIRGTWQRVHFGDDWVHESVLEVYRDMVARHRVMLANDPGESSLAMLDRGEMPPLQALMLHNGTVYRWNRPCYGVAGNVPHLRIEHRPLPAGPTVIDEVANVALYLGLVLAFDQSGEDVREAFQFSDVKANFVAGARYGLDATFRWRDGETVPARELVADVLVPIARDGLRQAGLPEGEWSRYLGVIEERARSGRNGARWQLDAFEALEAHGNRARRTQLVTRALMSRQWRGEPVHTWDGVDPADPPGGARCDRVADLMTTDLFTVGPDDLLDLAVHVMEWKHVRHVPVVDEDGRLVGLLAARDLLRRAATSDARNVPVRDLMEPAPRVVEPDTPCREALRRMREADVGCLPVVLRDRLIGIVSERDFLALIDGLLADAEPAGPVGLDAGVATDGQTSSGVG